MVRIAVLGCGLLGVKIAGEFAYHGHRVKCYDNNIQALNSVYTRYQSDKAELLNDQVVDSLNFTGNINRMRLSSIIKIFVSDKNR